MKEIKQTTANSFYISFTNHLIKAIIPTPKSTDHRKKLIPNTTELRQTTLNCHAL